MFVKGQSGNPAGRPKGSKHKIKADLLDAFAADFEAFGITVIEKVRLANPLEYLKLAFGLLPKEEQHTHEITAVRWLTEVESQLSPTVLEGSSFPSTTEENDGLASWPTDGQAKQ